MIIFAISLYSEAKPFIHLLNLKKNTKEHLFQLFEGENHHIIITGCGMIPSAISLTRYFTLYPPKDTDIFINLGIAGYRSEKSTPDNSLIGTLFFISKITEQCTKRTFYPDIIYQHNFNTLPLITTPLVMETTSDILDTPTLVDMEASSFYQATLPYISPERMFFFKIISDIIGTTCLQTQTISPEQLVAPHVHSILDFATKLQTIQTTNILQKTISFTETEQLRINQISSRLSFTETMAGEFRRLITYAKLDNKPLEQILTTFFHQLPETAIRGKKQTMPYLTALREQILEAHSITTNTTMLPTNQTNYLPFFSMVYVEKQIQEQVKNFSFLNEPVLIEHYKDLFNRSHQNFSEQKKAPSLILAKKTGTLIYEGAPVCQSFGNEHFYYTSCMMNCIYHCDYCYLQGMYPSGHVVVFVNLDDYFKELEQLLQQHPVYLCISYDTDLLALESRFGFVKRWLLFASKHSNLSLEIRTKSGNPQVFKELAKLYEDSTLRQQIIFAWTVSPKTIIETIEHGSASLSLRLKALRSAKEAGFSVRLCFDPMIYHNNWKSSYKELISTIFSEIPANFLFDVSIGVFRISTEYLKNMRKKRPDCAIVQYPYITEQGVSHYGTLSEEMVHYLQQLLLSYLPEEKIFIWNGGI